MSFAAKSLVSRARGYGFTLLELLVVMALLSVVMLALAASVRSIAQTDEKVAQRFLRIDDLRVSASFIRSTLGRISTRKVLGSQQAGASSMFFFAEPNAITWVGVMPARFGVGGRYFFRLAVELSSDTPALVIRFLPWMDGPGFPEWSQSEARVLVKGVTAFSIRYEDALAMPITWLSTWPFPDRLPERVALNITNQNDVWPLLLISLRPLPSASSSADGDGFVVGGSR
jgi:general secretion pathway protein J